MVQIDFKFFSDTRGGYIVGGSLRDILSRRAPIDYDIAVLGDPHEFARQVAKNTNGRLVQIGKSGQMIIRVIAAKKIIDIARLNGTSIEEDLEARDFRVNAMAYDLSAHRLIDHLGAQRDLASKTIRMVSTDIFNQDPIRLLRAFRLAATLEFDIESNTIAAIKAHAPLIEQSAGERIRAELFKMFQSAKSHRSVYQMAETGLLFAILPELRELKQCRQNRYHQFNAFEHTLRAFYHLEDLLDVDQSKPAGKRNRIQLKIAESRLPLLKFGMLLHDIGKPAVKTVGRDGVVHFYGHAHQSAQMADAICKRLKCSTRDTTTIYSLVRHHTRPLSLFTAQRRQKANPRAATRFFMSCAEFVPELLMLAAADMLGKEKEPNKRAQAFIKFLHQLHADFEKDFKPKKSTPPLITGEDLIAEFGLKPSALFKKLLDRVEEERLSRKEMRREEALALVQELIRDQRKSGNK